MSYSLFGFSLAIRPLRQGVFSLLGSILLSAGNKTGKTMVPTFFWVGRKETKCNYTAILVHWFETTHSFPSEGIDTSLIGNSLRFGVVGDSWQVHVCMERLAWGRRWEGDNVLLPKNMRK